MTLIYGVLSASFSDPKRSRIVLIPVPYDATSTWQKGSSKGPQALIEASRNMELYDIETGGEVYRRGIFTDQTLTLSSSTEQMVYAEATTVLPLIVSYAYHKGDWKTRKARKWQRIFTSK